jgi:hypothetical protein
MKFIDIKHKKIHRCIGIISLKDVYIQNNFKQISIQKIAN